MAKWEKFLRVALSALEASILPFPDKIYDATFKRLNEILASYPTLEAVVRSAHPLFLSPWPSGRRHTSLVCVVIGDDLPAEALGTILLKFLEVGLSLQDMSGGVRWPLTTPIIHAILDLHHAATVSIRLHPLRTRPPHS